MAKGKGEIKGWITRNGVHIPIYGNYSVRGGVEPKAKGSKFKGKKKKRPENFKEGLKQHEGIQQIANDQNEKVWNGGASNQELYDAADKFAEEKNFNKEKVRDAAFSAFNEKWVATQKERANVKAEQESRKAEGQKSNSFQEQVNDRFKTKKEWDEIAKNAGYKDSSDSEFQKNADDIVAKNKQASSKPDFSKMSYSEAGAYVAEHKKDFGLSEGADAYQAAYEIKKGTWEGKMPGQESSKATPESYAQSKGKSIRDIAQEVNANDAARAQANQLMKDGRTYDEAAALAHSDMERGVLKGQESSSKYDKVSPGGASEWSGITDRGVMEAVQNGNKAGIEEMSRRGLSTLSDYQNFKNEQKSSNPDFSKMSYSEAGKYVAEHKKDFGLSKDDDAYMAAYDIKNNGKKIGQRLLDNTTPEKEQRIKDNGWLGENGQLKRTEKSTKVGALPTTVSGLRSAYANATGSEKAKISAELRRKGYTLVGGKWVKGK